MELKFTNTSCRCLEPVLREVQNLEQTQQIRIPDGLPDIGRVVGAWGQPVIRSKDWRHDSIGFSGGMLVWVLYAPENGESEQVVTGWIPFQCRWDLPEDAEEGQIRLHCLSRAVDGRSVSPRKLLVRAGMAVMVEGYSPVSVQTTVPMGEAPELELLRRRYPLRLNREAGEKAFLLEETFPVSDGEVRCQAILSCSLEPKLTECRVLAEKLVFRGTGKLKLLCRYEDGRAAVREFDLPFSQYTQLEGLYEADPAADVVFGVTSLEPEQEEDGQLHIRCGVVAQYLINDREMVEVLQDAYSLQQELQLAWDEAEFPVQLDSRRENMHGERTVRAEADRIEDSRYLPDFPRVQTTDTGVSVIVPGSLQLLCTDAAGNLFTLTEKWDLEHRVPADRDAQINASVLLPELQTSLSGGQIAVKAELPLQVNTAASQRIPMILSVEPGARKSKDAARPSLVLMRGNGQSLWDLAKENATTMEAIQKASGFTGEPELGQLLLIPVL